MTNRDSDKYSLDRDDNDHEHENKTIMQPRLSIFSRQETFNIPIMVGGIDEDINPDDSEFKNDEVDIKPHPASHLMSQSDISGMQKKVNAPVYDEKPNIHKRSYYRRIFCCFQKQKSVNLQRTLSNNEGVNRLDVDPRSRTRVSILEPQVGTSRGKKCLVLDLDETLVHYYEHNG